MNRRERAEYVEDGRSGQRREHFQTAQRVSRAWEAAHPWSLEDFFDFLDALQAMFGPFPQRREVWRGGDFRL
jgi:hypothetical protein